MKKDFVPDEMVKSFFPIFVEKIKHLHKNGNLVVAVTLGFQKQVQLLQSITNDFYFLCLKTDKKILIERIRNRKGHFFSTQLLEQTFDSKYNISYPCITIDASGTLDEVINLCLERIKIPPKK